MRGRGGGGRKEGMKGRIVRAVGISMWTIFILISLCIILLLGIAIVL